MTKYFVAAVAALWLPGCCGSTSAVDTAIKGEYLVPLDDLPPRVRQLAGAIERMPREPSQDEFETVLVKVGLNKIPDWFKDGQHLWYFDADFKPDSSLERRKYVVSIGYLELKNSRIIPYDAGIHRLNSGDKWRETLWQIDWPIRNPYLR